MKQCFGLFTTISSRLHVDDVDGGKVAAFVKLDLSATFDTADHSILLSVLRKRFGVIDTALDWFTSSLSDRSQSFVGSGHRISVAFHSHAVFLNAPSSDR